MFRTKTDCFVEKLFDFADGHGLVNGEIGVTNGGVGRSGSVSRRDGVLVSRTALNFVRVPITTGLFYSERSVGNEFLQTRAGCVQRDVGALRLSDLDQVIANAGERNGLRGSGAFVGGGHLFQVRLINDEQQGCRNENNGQSTHEESLNLGETVDKAHEGLRCAKSNRRGGWIASSGKETRPG